VLCKDDNHDRVETLFGPVAQVLLHIFVIESVEQLPSRVAEVKEWLVAGCVTDEMSTTCRWLDGHRQRQLNVRRWSRSKSHDAGFGARLASRTGYKHAAMRSCGVSDTGPSMFTL
jgi:hypothetical protein